MRPILALLEQPPTGLPALVCLVIGSLVLLGVPTAARGAVRLARTLWATIGTAGGRAGGHWRRGAADPLADDREAAAAWCLYRNARAASAWQRYERVRGRRGAWTMDAQQARATYEAARDAAYAAYDAWALLDGVSGPVRRRAWRGRFEARTWSIPGMTRLPPTPARPRRFRERCPSAPERRDGDG